MTQTLEDFSDLSVVLGDDFVAQVEIRRPPSNFFDVPLLRRLADIYDLLDADPRCRAIVLCSEGKHFCAGAQFDPDTDGALPKGGAAGLYTEAVRLFASRTPVVAAIQGAAIGGGLGLACSADLRVAAPEARFSANFARLGFHHGFGLTITLPMIVGSSSALDLLYTGRRVTGEEAHAMGLSDRIVPIEKVRSVAHDLAGEIAASGPLAVQAIRQTMRGHLAGAVTAATHHESEEQARLRATTDFAEGIRASAERRPPVFEGR
jgi:2-(1,2-epoxy-1,2-dihydrophenyl)acetyl-CoA isomerase